MPVVHPYTGQIQAYLEGGEGIGSKKTMQDKRQYNVSGTASQIFSLLNGMNGGVEWSSGARLIPKWTTQRPVQMNIPLINSSLNSVRRFYADGGSFGVGPSQAGTAPGESEALMKMLAGVGATLNNVNATLLNLQKNGVKAHVVLSEIQAQMERMKAIEDDAAIKPGN